MVKVYFKNDYNSVLNDLRDKRFYIFGTTWYAQIFYLFCRENHADRNIEAFLLSDGKNNNRKLQLLHGIPIKRMSEIKDAADEYHIFLAGRERIIQEQLLPLMNELPEACVYYVNDFTNHVMRERYLSETYARVLQQHYILPNPYDPGWNYIYDVNSRQQYKYLERVTRGVLPDENVFGEDVTLDVLHEKQLGRYEYIHGAAGAYDGEHRCRIYLVKSHMDKALDQDYFTPYTETIQAGAALTELEISPLKDNIGENISARNRDYSEMSAIYWAWKNDKTSDYLGFCHYRRRFVVDERTISFIMSNEYDAVYTVPKLTEGGMREEFVEREYYLTPEMWKLTEAAIRKLSPEYAHFWTEFEKSYFLLSCNMFIMRRDIFHDYCSWVFPVLAEVDGYYLNQGIQCDNRYLGYIGECLTTVYAMKNKDSLKKGYVELKRL